MRTPTSPTDRMNKEKIFAVTFDEGSNPSERKIMGECERGIGHGNFLLS
jgi:hypothetical protein